MARGRIRNDIHQQVTDQIVAMIRAGQGNCVLPWQRGGVCSARPGNAVTKNAYHGINVLTLWAAALRCGFSSGLWATYRQWQSTGAQVRKGERGCAVVFYKQIAKTAGDGEEETFLIARSSTVFAAEQVDGYAAPTTKDNEVTSLTDVDAFIGATGAVIEHRGDVACYSPSRDVITMPTQERFIGTAKCDATEGYYAVLLHELTHWTGHRRRCDRRAIRSYAFEELVAELGAAFLCADLKVSQTVRDDHAGYLAGWLTELENDKKAIFRAASLAERAVGFLNELQPDSSVAA